MSIPKKAITIGLSGFPYGMAATRKLKYMASSLVLIDYSFTVISNTFIKKSDLNKKLTKSGIIDNISYLTTSPYVFSPNNFHKKLYGKTLGVINEFFLILTHKYNCVFIYSMNFLYTVFYGSLLNFLGRPVCLVYFEMRSKVDTRKKWYHKINDFLFDNYIFTFVNGVVLISEELKKHLNKRYPNKPSIKIPPLVNFSEFNAKRLPKEDYFLFCGSLEYLDIIKFIIRSFLKIAFPHSCKLYLVVNGDRYLLSKLVSHISELGLEGKVRLLSGLSKQDLYFNYINSKALLIPIRNTAQDKARFPQKIAEYTASKRPIITCNNGEIKNYFDESSAFISENYDIKEYAQQMQKAIENPSLCDQIGRNGFEIGKHHFDYHNYSVPFDKFLQNL